MAAHDSRNPTNPFTPPSPSVTSTAMLAHDRRLLVVLQATLLVPVDKFAFNEADEEAGTPAGVAPNPDYEAKAQARSGS